MLRFDLSHQIEALDLHWDSHFLHCTLCTFHAAFWHSLLQYRTLPHPPQVSSWLDEVLHLSHRGPWGFVVIDAVVPGAVDPSMVGNRIKDSMYGTGNMGAIAMRVAYLANGAHFFSFVKLGVTMPSPQQQRGL